MCRIFLTGVWSAEGWLQENPVVYFYICVDTFPIETFFIPPRLALQIYRCDFFSFYDFTSSKNIILSDLLYEKNFF